MELSTAQEDDIEAILKKHPTGVNHDTMWDQATMFDDKVELSKGIHQMTQLGRIFKRGMLYFLVGAEIPDVPEQKVEPKKDFVRGVPFKKREEYVQPAPEASACAVTSVQSPIDQHTGNAKREMQIPPKPAMPSDNADAQINRPKEGSVMRTAGQGAAALALYKWRNERPLTLDDIVEITGAPRTTIYAAMPKLVDQGYAIKGGKNAMHTFWQWSGEYRYPFVRIDSNDDRFIKVSLKEWKARHTLMEMPTAQIKSTDETDSTVGVVAQETGTCDGSGVCENDMFNALGTPVIRSTGEDMPGAVKYIDSQIQMLEQHLTSLRQVRQYLLPSRVQA